MYFDEIIPIVVILILQVYLMSYSSKLLQEAVDAFSTLPGIGKKSALRMAMYLINKDQDEMINGFVRPINELIDNIKFCSDCHHLSDKEICNICYERRNKSNTICVVESIRDVMAIEDTNQYNDLYHVLGGVISPLDGISAEDININSLINRVEKYDIQEVILAISPTIEGDTTMYYISKKLSEFDVKVSLLARGISFGGELEYADELTLGRSIVTRTEYKINGL